MKPYRCFFGFLLLISGKGQEEDTKKGTAQILSYFVKHRRLCSSPRNRHDISRRLDDILGRNLAHEETDRHVSKLLDIVMTCRRIVRNCRDVSQNCRGFLPLPGIHSQSWHSPRSGGGALQSQSGGSETGTLANWYVDTLGIFRYVGRTPKLLRTLLKTFFF